jgi:hypothetical protein
MPDKLTLEWTNGRGKQVSREVNMTINVDDFKNTPGLALLVLAANPHLSIYELRLLLEVHWGVDRGKTWIQKRRWLFQKPDTENCPGIKPNADGKAERAIAIMRENRMLSLSLLVRLLASSGIRRGREWVRQHRCD